MAAPRKVVVRYRKLGREQALGTYCPRTGVVEIDARLKGRKRLTILIHEFTHKLAKEKFPNFYKTLRKNFPRKIADEMEEILVIEVSENLSRWLWENGVRIKNKKP